MRVVPPPLDLPREPAEAAAILEARLATLGADEAALVRWRRDLRELLGEGWQGWPAVDGPAAWYFLVHRSRPRPAPHAEVAAARAGWRDAFRRYREAMAAGEGGAAFERAVRDELEREEQTLFPLWRELTGDERAPRELAYEIVGIRKGLERLDEVLEGVRTGRATRRERERYDIDFFHLVEHHVERLERSVFPVLDLLLGG